jgi:5-methylcytosine-specific restriction endonuclease McrA
MPFSECIKEEVKRKAAFRCCRCQQIGVEVHHILPEKDGGTDDINNAAPLCPNCHDYFGDNPIKRKEITQMRDWWYEKVEKMFPSQGVGLETLGEINRKLDGIRKGISDVSELKPILKSLSDRLIDSITPSTASVAASSILNLPPFRIGGSGRIINICSRCGAEVAEWHEDCPNCGAKIREI